MKRLGTFFVAAALAAAAHAHGGDDHGGGDHAPAATAATSSAAGAARAGTSSEDFELVAVLDGDQLLLYLDDYASNAPVADALVELASGTAPRAAVQVAPGTYALDAGALATPGSHPLTVSVQAGERSDLLVTVLEVVAPTAPPARTWPDAREMLPWTAAGAILLAGGAVALRRHRIAARGRTR